MAKKHRVITGVSTKDHTFVVGEDSPVHRGLCVKEIGFMQTGAQGVYNPINIPAPHYKVLLEDPFHPEDSTFRIIPMNIVQSVDYQEVIEQDQNAEDVEVSRAD